MAHSQPATDWMPADRQPTSQPLLASEQGRRSIDSSTVAPHSEHSSDPSRPGPSPNAYNRVNTEESDESAPRKVTGEMHSKQGLQSPTRWKGTRNVLMVWLEEVLILLLSIGILISIVAILHRFHNQKQPDWGGGITLNALIAVLATIFRASLAFVAFEIIGQVKWDWIARSPRPLQDVQLFDNAARGVPGSLRLIGLISFRLPLVLVAILLAIVSLGIGSFTQQAIQTWSCIQPASNPSAQAVVTVANRVRNGYILDNGYAASAEYNETWRLALENAIVNPTADSRLPSNLFNCPTGNCTFTEYGGSGNTSVTHASLGLCNRCADVYDLVTGPFKVANGSGAVTIQLPVPPPAYENVTELQLSTGSTYENQYLQIRRIQNLTWAGKYASNEMLNLERYAINKFAILALSQAKCGTFDNGTLDCPTNIYAWGTVADYVAATCIVYPCMKYYRGEVDNNVFSEKLVGETPLRPQTNKTFDSADEFDYKDWSAVQQPCRVNGTVYTSQNMSKADSLDASAKTVVMSVSEGFEKEDRNEKAKYTNITAPNECVGTLDSSVMTGIFDASSAWCDSQCNLDPRGGVMVCGEWYNRNLMRNRTTTFENIQESIDTITRGLTNQIRNAARGVYSDEAEPVSGEAWQVDICIKIAWGWIAFPAGLCLICVMLLAVVLIQNSIRNRSPVWKNSVLPMLLKDHPGIGGMEISQVERTARGYVIRLEHDGDQPSMEVTLKMN